MFALFPVNLMESNILNITLKSYEFNTNIKFNVSHIKTDNPHSHYNTHDIKIRQLIPAKKHFPYSQERSPLTTRIYPFR